MWFIMLAKKYRLTKRGSFAYVYRKGGAVRGKYMTLIYVSGKETPRLGLSVNNKVGHAVVRNKLKRRMREVMRSYLSEYKALPGYFCRKKQCRRTELCRRKRRNVRAFEKKRTSFMR